MDATENWWGDPGGPGEGNGDAVSDGVDYPDWLNEPASVIVATGADTIFLPVGSVDTVGAAFRNWADETDSLAVSVTETFDWLTGPAQQTVHLSEHTGGGILLGMNIPENVTDGQLNLITTTATSLTHTGKQDIDSVIINPYHPLISRLTIFPDSGQVALNDTLQFAAIAYDQHQYPVDFEPVWRAATGDINADGLYVAPSFTTTDTVWVTDAGAEVEVYAVITVVDATGIEENGDQINKGFILSQNYPNPFSSTTTIKYQVTKSTYVTLEVFDVLGNRVATLVNGFRAAGKYEVEFKATNLNNGIYYYSLRSDGITETGKMILLNQN